LPVPSAAAKTTETGSGFSEENIIEPLVSQDRDFLDDLSGVVQPKSRQRLGTVSVIR